MALTITLFTGMSFVGGSVAWRFPLAFQFFFIFILWATVPWLPESPRWLIMHGRKEEAVVILAALESKGVEDPLVITQLHEIEETVAYEREHSVRWRDLFSAKRRQANEQGGNTKTVRRLLLGAGTQFMQQVKPVQLQNFWSTRSTDQLLSSAASTSCLTTSLPCSRKPSVSR